MRSNQQHPRTDRQQKGLRRNRLGDDSLRSIVFATGLAKPGRAAQRVLNTKTIKTPAAITTLEEKQ
ncbi:hypothetical protein [Niveibacterium sp. COAC-50]|uniref:hypothetical protein n=1 Tax=Niveibacterium sp. COAC-50 TaxID=2729384 RepID=UPI001557E6F8|nr:hypothetical protein [Niveibacterium sp. COAC-50]